MLFLKKPGQPVVSVNRYRCEDLWYSASFIMRNDGLWGRWGTVTQISAETAHTKSIHDPDPAPWVAYFHGNHFPRNGRKMSFARDTLAVGARCSFSSWKHDSLSPSVETKGISRSLLYDWLLATKFNKIYSFIVQLWTRKAKQWRVELSACGRWYLENKKNKIKQGVSSYWVGN